MSRDSNRQMGQHPPRGALGYLQIPAFDIASSGAFYEAVFGWSVELEYGSFEAPGLIGQFTADLTPAASGGPVSWLCADLLWPTLEGVLAGGGKVRGRPQLDGGERWLVEIDDPAGNRIGVVVPVRAAQSQTMIAVRDVEASSRWYQRLLGLTSDHGGAEYERLLSGGVLVLQLHHRNVEHHHGRFAAEGEGVGNGVLLWFGEVTDFDAVVERAGQLGATITRPPHRNPAEAQDNGPSHREIWLLDLDGYTVVAASPDGEAFEPSPA